MVHKQALLQTHALQVLPLVYFAPSNSIVLRAEPLSSLSACFFCEMAIVTLRLHCPCPESVSVLVSRDRAGNVP